MYNNVTLYIIDGVGQNTTKFGTRIYKLLWMHALFLQLQAVNWWLLQATTTPHRIDWENKQQKKLKLGTLRFNDVMAMRTSLKKWICIISATYCLFDVLIPVCIVGSLSPYWTLPQNKMGDNIVVHSEVLNRCKATCVLVLLNCMFKFEQLVIISRQSDKTK